MGALCGGGAAHGDRGALNNWVFYTVAEKKTNFEHYCLASKQRKQKTIDNLFLVLCEYATLVLQLVAIREAQLKSEYMNYTYWMPCTWASCLLVQAHEQKYIETAKYVVDMCEELGKLRTGCGVIICYDWISLPLVYTQV